MIKYISGYLHYVIVIVDVQYSPYNLLKLTKYMYIVTYCVTYTSEYIYIQNTNHSLQNTNHSIQNTNHSIQNPACKTNLIHFISHLHHSIKTAITPQKLHHSINGAIKASSILKTFNGKIISDMKVSLNTMNMYLQ